MRAYGWFVFGFVMSVFVALSLGACTFDASGMGGEPASSTDSSSASPSIGPGALTPQYPRAPLAPAAKLGLSIVVEAPAAAEQIGVAGSDLVVATYRVRNDDDQPHRLARFTVVATESSIASEVAYTLDESPIRSDVLPPSADGSVMFTLHDGIIPAHAERRIDVMTTLAQLSDDSMDSPRSGMMSQFILASATDDAGVEISTVQTADPMRVTLRKSLLTIVPDSLNTTLTNGWHDLYRWHVLANPSGDVAVKQFAFRMEIDAVNACSFRLKRGSSLLSVSDVMIVARDPMTDELIDLRDGCVNDDTVVTIIFRTEQVVPAAALTAYGLRARLMDCDSFARVQTSFDAQSVSVTSALSPGLLPLASLVGDVAPSVIWSDLSAAVHSSKIGHSSSDWIGDAALTDLSVAQTLE